MLQVAVAAIQPEQALTEVVRLRLRQALGGEAAGLDLQPGMGHQLGAFVFPVAIGAWPEALDVQRCYIRGNAAGLDLGPVVLL